MPQVATLARTMPDLRAAVLREMKRQKRSRYWLVLALRGKRPGGGNVPATIIYTFLRGESSINSDDLGLIFDALGMKPVGRKTGREPSC